jgi:hypothetical protein
LHPEGGRRRESFSTAQCVGVVVIPAPGVVSTVEVVVVDWVIGSGVPVADGASLVVEVSVVVVVVSRFWHPSERAAVPAIRKPTRVIVLFICAFLLKGPVAGPGSSTVQPPCRNSLSSSVRSSLIVRPDVTDRPSGRA